MSSAIIPITNSKDYSGFEPRAIASCVLWLDGRDSSTLFQDTAGTVPVSANLDPVKCWKDKSVQANNATTSGTGMQYLLNGGGVSNLTFTVLSLTPSKLPTGTTNISTFIVFQPFKRNADANTQVMLTWGTQSTGQAPQYFISQTAAGSGGDLRLNVDLYAGGGATDTVSLATGSLTNKLLSSVLTSNNNSWRDGTAFTTTNTAITLNTGTTVAFLGAQTSAGSLVYGGFYREIIIYNVPLTTLQRQQVEGYLANKWGILSFLPTSHPYRNAPLYMRPFIPLDTGVCTFWIDAADGPTVTVNSNSIVTGVADKSGNNFNLSNSMTTTGFAWDGPTKFNTSYPSFFYNGASQTITLGSNSSPSIAATTGIFTVQQLVGSASVQDVFDSVSGTRLFGFYFLPSASTPNYRIFQGSTIVSGSTSVTTPAIYSSIFTGSTNSQIYENGTLAVTGNAGTGTGTGIVIGSRQSLNQETFQGHIAEVIYYNGNLTTNANINIRFLTEGYLAWKWRLNGFLPATHPFKLYPPMVVPFNPLQIANCILWLDAADPSAYTMSGANLATWIDKSTNQYSCAPVSGNDITRSTRNGLNVFYMNNTRARISNFVWTNDSTIFFVTNCAASSFLYSQWTTTYTNYAFVANNNLFFVGSARDYRDSVLPSGTPVQPANKWALFNIGYNATSRVVTNYALNGTTRAAVVGAGGGTAPGVGTSTATLFINGNGNNASDSTFVAEIIQYNRSLATAERQQIEGYLAWKWGLNGGIAPSLGTFTPLSISGCQLWLDAADSSTLTLSGSNVTTWADKSGNGRNTSTLFRAPTFSNGAVRFNNQGLSVNLSASTNVESGFFVAGFTNYGQGNTLIGAATGSGGRQFRVGTSAIIQTLRQDVAGVLSTGAAVPAATTVLVEYVNNGSLLTHYLNGGTYASGTAAAYTAGLTSTIGQRFGDFASEALVGYINEIIVFNVALTTIQRQQVEGYLANKWGVQGSLPNNHPYASTTLPLTHPYRKINPG